MTRYLLDTNVLVRFLVRDDPRQFARAAALFQQTADGRCELIVTHILLAETIWVLTSPRLYDVPRADVADRLASLVVQPGVRCADAPVVLDALARFKATPCSFFDCYLAATAAATGDRVASFDKDLQRFKDVEHWQPGKGA